MIRWITCREFVEFLADYLEGRLKADRLDEFNNHLAGCPPCVIYMQTYRDSIALAKAALHASDDPVPETVPDGLVEAYSRAEERRLVTPSGGGSQRAARARRHCARDQHQDDHTGGSYPGLEVIRPGRWDLSRIVPARADHSRPGWREVFGYENRDGGRLRVELAEAPCYPRAQSSSTASRVAISGGRAALGMRAPSPRLPRISFR